MAKSTSGTFTINGTRNNDLFEVSKNAPGEVLLNGASKSYPAGSVPTLSGDRGDDTFVVHGDPKLYSFSGGAGYDTLDFSPYTVAIGVSLLESGPRSGSVQYIYLNPVWTYMEGYSSGYYFDISMSEPLRNVLGVENAYGGSAGDFLRGNFGVNTLRGNGGDDHLDGHDGADLLVGGDGNDLMLGAGGDDIIWGDNDSSAAPGSGADHFVIAGHSYSNDTIMDYRLADGDVLSFTFTDRWSYIPTDWIYDAARGGMYGTLADGTSSVLLKGVTAMSQVAVLIEGRETGETIHATSLSETIRGNLGQDILFGGAGTDIFQFNATHSSVGAPDTVMDFDTGELLDFMLVDVDAATPGRQGLTFSETGAALNSVWIVQSSSGLAEVFADTNGDSVADFALNVQGTFSSLGQSDLLL